MNKQEAFGLHWHSQMEGGRIIHSDKPYEWYSDDVITLNGETLELSFRENQRAVQFGGITYHPTIEKAVFRTEESFGFGTFSADIQLPKGRNITGALWMSGSGNWPPEIDICEFWRNYTYLRFGTWRATSNVHYRNEVLEHSQIGSKNVSWLDMCDPCKAFHNYKCRWEPDRITFYVDGKVVRNITGYACEALTRNLLKPERGYKMNIILSCGVDKDPRYTKTRIDTPMKIRNFEYKPLEIL